jgi:hypothetical protein
MEAKGSAQMAMNCYMLQDRNCDTMQIEHSIGHAS